MTRVRVRTLVLVNWKGVFYEQYCLNQHVTALEGDNGAGKTTVMIGAYVVLLPDMTRLRFTNVGETDTTGGDKGLWGRLGNPNRPSYTFMVFDTGHEQVIAGVHLERKGEPSVELKPLLISGLPEDIQLQDVLLLRSDEDELVPELGELQERVARFGGKLRPCESAKEYFAGLFERGITPLRLAADEERTRFNEMLRTSMTGGISRSLTSDFRSFVLKEESGLADTLGRMRGNLDACRRTRGEVKDAQELEREITGVYEAGHAMFAAALLATRERAEELRRRMDDARTARDNAQRERNAVAEELRGQQDERRRVERELTGARDDHAEARTRHELVRAANRIAQRLVMLEGELSVLDEQVAAAAVLLARAEQVMNLRADERRRAEETYYFAAEGLADLERGLQEYHRRADGYRTVTRRLNEARILCERPDLVPEEVDAFKETIQQQIVGIDRRRHELDAAVGSAEARASDYRVVLAALEFILRRTVDAVDAHDQARAVLRQLSELDELAGRAKTLEDDLEKVRERLRRQDAVRTKAQNLSLPEEPLESFADVREAVRRADQIVHEARERARAEQEKVEEQQRVVRKLKDEEQTLKVRSLRWRELDAVATRLEAVLGAGLRSASELEAARHLFDGERDVRQRLRDDLEKRRDESRERIRSLEQSGGMFHSDLLVARDVVGGELLASHFDDVSPERAGRVQARLGPLSDAIVVDDAHVAAAALAGRERTLDTIWLVEEGGLHSVAGLDVGDEPGLTDVIVETDGVVRTTRVPRAPTLGRKAREGVIADLRVRMDDLGREIEEVDDTLGEIASRRRDTALLMVEITTLALGDPAEELAQVAVDLYTSSILIGKHELSAAEAQRDVQRQTGRAEALQNLLADAFLLDEPDLQQKAREQEDTWRASVRARGELARVAHMRPVLADRIDALRYAPLTEAEIEEMRDELARLRDQRNGLFTGAEALDYVSTHRDALEWSDAEAALSEKRELVPALKEQCDKAARARETASDAARQAEEARDRQRSDWRDIDDERNAKEALRRQTRRELEATGVDDASPQAVERAAEAERRLSAYLDTLDRRERQLAETIAQQQERFEVRERDLLRMAEQLSTAEKDWRPAADLWDRLRSRAEANGLVTPVITARLLDVAEGSSVKLRTDARTSAALLVERLRSARGGNEIDEHIASLLSGQELTTGDDLLEAWHVVRDWIRRRVPAQVAEVDDPLEALERLRRHLKVLADRLDDQERKLRGTSEDVARGIEVHIRAAQRQMRLLNKELQGVRFGTIRAMQISLSRDERMGQVLSALREGAAQELLFAPTMPVEDALELLFTRYGGRGQTVGQKLLDYREYVDIAVEIQRQSSPNWERVNPSRISTGEAIGVGTALMMIVLTAWERAANLFRARRSLGTLRLLFLDEANRLSQDNLEVLFELCATLDLQLLIAAPEVARAPGCTTYRLVRSETRDGSEEVVATGRRTIAEK